MDAQLSLFDPEPEGAGDVDGYAAVLREARRIAGWEAKGGDPDDLAQQAVERFWRRFGTGPGPVNLTAWLTRTIKNLAIDSYRARRGRDGQRPEQRDLDLQDYQMIGVPGLVELSPSWQYVGLAACRQVLAELNEREREVFQQRADDVPATQVAERLGLTRDNVDQIYRRARLRLRELLERDPDLGAAVRDTYVEAPCSAELPTAAGSSTRPGPAATEDLDRVVDRLLVALGWVDRG